MSDKIMKINNKEYSCSIELTLDIIGGKWKPINSLEISPERCIKI